MTLFLARLALTTVLKAGHRATTLRQAVVPRPESCPATAMACLPGSSCLSAAMLSRRGSIASALDRQFQRSATRPASTWPCSPYQMPPAQQPFFRPSRSLDGEPWPSGGGAPALPLRSSPPPLGHPTTAPARPCQTKSRSLAPWQTLPAAIPLGPVLASVSTHYLSICDHLLRPTNIYIVRLHGFSLASPRLHHCTPPPGLALKNKKLLHIR